MDIRSPHSELEARIYTYRLLIAAPWAARNAMEGHHIAKGIGKLFDSIPARYTDNNLIREAGNLMCYWGDRWLNRIARVRRQSIDAERGAAGKSYSLGPPPLHPHFILAHSTSHRGGYAS